MRTSRQRHTPVFQSAIDSLGPGKAERIALKNDIPHIGHHDMTVVAAKRAHEVEVKEIPKSVIWHIFQTSRPFKRDKQDCMIGHAFQITSGF